jgi:CRP/FNR family transcriptional regulator, cyclic AMP receptor protein
MTSHVTTIDSCRLLLEDPDLADAIPAERRAQATEELVTSCLSIAPGAWEPPDPDRGAIGLVILEGVLLRHVEIDGRYGLELLGETDMLRPWQGGEAPMLDSRVEYSVLAPARLAWLDGRAARVLTRYPELTDRLFERVMRRSRHLVANMAIVHQPRVDTRLQLLLWHLAGRWGRVRRDGVVLPLKLTHALLADLVAARRPTVTSALSDLTRRGLLRQTDDGWMLFGQSPAVENGNAPADAYADLAVAHGRR